MATAAQIEANRLNCKKSTGPKSKRGKARARLNALKHGMSATTVFPVLPHEDPKQLEGRIQQFLNDLQPRNEFERELVIRAARLSWAIDLARKLALSSAWLASRIRPKMRQTKPIWNRRKALREMVLNSKGPPRRVANKAKVLGGNVPCRERGATAIPATTVVKAR
jgi:hypothetical protein